jgi:hypothetical protein
MVVRVEHMFAHESIRTLNCTCSHQLRPCVPLPRPKECDVRRAKQNGGVERGEGIGEHVTGCT